MQTLTNTINTVGVMGAGIAKEFKSRYPAMYEDYKQKCEQHEIRTGYPYLWQSTEEQSIWVLNFPTKQHWRNKSKIEWVEEGLKYLLQHYQDWGIQSLAMSALGCGLGGLNWNQVKPLMETYLSQMDIPVEVYEPIPEEKRPPKKQNQKSQPKTSPQPNLFQNRYDDLTAPEQSTALGAYIEESGTTTVSDFTGHITTVALPDQTHVTDTSEANLLSSTSASVDSKEKKSP